MEYTLDQLKLLISNAERFEKYDEVVRLQTILTNKLNETGAL